VVLLQYFLLGEWKRRGDWGIQVPIDYIIRYVKRILSRREGKVVCYFFNRYIQVLTVLHRVGDDWHERGGIYFAG